MWERYQYVLYSANKNVRNKFSESSSSLRRRHRNHRRHHHHILVVTIYAYRHDQGGGHVQYTHSKCLRI